MKNNTNDGIYCDYCGDEFKEDFIYYSLDFKQVEIGNSYRELDNIIASHDICNKCMDLFRNRIIEISSKIPESPNRCDITGCSLTNKFFRCYISEVDVNISSQPYVCNVCNKKCDHNGCKCEGSESVRNALVNVDSEYLTLNFCESIFNRFKGYVGNIMNIGDVEWTK